MNFQNLEDSELDLALVDSVKTETAATLRVLHLLREAERRRLFSKFWYPNLTEYAVRRLGYSQDQAWRRIDAMRLLVEIPEIEGKIANGSLNLTNVGYANSAFKAEAKNNQALNKDEKLAFLERIENKSTRETQKIVADEFGKEALLRETVKPVTRTASLLTLPVQDELLEIIDELKGLLAHSKPGITTTELFSLLAKEKLAALKKKKANGLAAPPKCVDAEDRDKPVGSSRYIPSHINRELWKRDQAKCTNCGSTYALERDHRLPYAKGGETSLINLRLLCRSCNQRAAIEEYGIKKMAHFLTRPIKGE